jgi:hypothetical protein
MENGFRPGDARPSRAEASRPSCEGDGGRVISGAVRCASYQATGGDACLFDSSTYNQPDTEPSRGGFGALGKHASSDGAPVAPGGLEITK